MFYHLDTLLTKAGHWAWSDSVTQWVTILFTAVCIFSLILNRCSGLCNAPKKINQLVFPSEEHSRSNRKCWSHNNPSFCIILLANGWDSKRPNNCSKMVGLWSKCIKPENILQQFILVRGRELVLYFTNVICCNQCAYKIRSIDCVCVCVCV